MITNVYSIRDSLAEIYNKPFTEINNATAIRAFSQSMQQTKNKEDYVLYHIGTFDDNAGSFTVNDPVKIFSGSEVTQEETTHA